MTQSTQQIDDLGGGLCVHAGAGSGKTSLLVKRYLEILHESQGGPGRIVAITFTEKAAAEMKSRIREAHPPLAGEYPAIPLPNGKTHLDSLAGARIGTIHAFCAGLLRQYPVEIGLDPCFRILDAVQADMLLTKTITAHWQRLVEQKDDRLWELMEHFSPADLMKIIEEIILQRAKVAECRPIWHRADKKFLLEALKSAQKSQTENKDIAKMAWSEADDRALRCGQLVLDLATDFECEFQKAKARTNHLDYEDLQLLALKLLQNPRVCKKVREDLHYLLVDEFQDTNELQRQIFYHLAPLQSIFVVGDPKQSIYRFRGSDVSVFRRIQQDMSQAGRVITRDINYRSRPGILAFCNNFFARLMCQSERPYEIPHQPMKPHRTDDGNLACVCAWQHASGTEEKIPVDELRKREAVHIADTLRQWMNTKAPRQGFRLQDVAILFRSMNKVYLYERELEKRNIPFTTTSTSAFYGVQCITDCLNALDAALHRTDDLALAGFLRSPMVGVSDETLFRLSGSPSLWDSLQDTADPVLIEARGRLDKWHTLSGLVPPSDLLKTILRDTDFEALLLTQNLGRRKVALVGKMVELAGRFKPQEGFTCRDFIDYMKELVLEENKEAEGPALEEADAVSLLTVHKAKGLEFPIVIIADLAHHQNLPSPIVLVDEEFGLGLKLRDEQDNTIKTVGRLLAELEEKRKDTAEAKRLLYVACTRAKDLLIFSGLNPASKTANLWNSWILDYLDSRPDKIITSSILLSPLAGEGRVGGNAVEEHSAWDFRQEHWAFAMKDFRQLNLLPDRLSVSEVENTLSPQRGEGRGEGAKITDTAQLGSMVHDVLARWDMRDTKDLPPIIDTILKEYYFPESALEDVRRRIHILTGHFASSVHGQMIRKSKKILREIPFIMPFQGRCIEGIIDCLYQDPNNSWAVLDYKTDDIRQQDTADRACHYEIQLKLYGAAALQILGLQEIRLELYFLASDVFHQQKFTLQDAQAFIKELQGKLKTE